MTRLTIIARAVAAETGVPVFDILSKRRSRPVTRARHMAWAIAVDLTELSYPQVARGFGGVHHTSVIDGVQRARARIAAEPDFRRAYTVARERAAANIKNRDDATETGRIIAEMVSQYEAKLRIMAQNRPAVFVQRFQNVVTP